jgi:predicted transglutaminase-like cysteine proteinase
MRGRYIVLGILIICVAFFVFSYFNKENLLSYENNALGNKEIINETTNEVELNLFFLDEKTNCTVNGKLYSKENLIGEVIDGKIKINSSDFSKIDSALSIKGKTGACFGRDANLPFYRSWELTGWNSIENVGNEEIFELNLDPRRPRYPEEMQGFIRPDEVSQKVDEINFDEEDTKIQDIERIFRRTYMNYASDEGVFSKEDYWQTPSDFLKNKRGDCEDWAIYAVSLLREYDPNLDCYAALWLTHMNVICAVNQTFLIFDQEQTQEQIKLDSNLIVQDNKIEINKWINNYFSDYGIDVKDRKLYYLFNEKEFISFNDWREELSNWVLEKGGILD